MPGSWTARRCESVRSRRFGASQRDHACAARPREPVRGLHRRRRPPVRGAHRRRDVRPRRPRLGPRTCGLGGADRPPGPELGRDALRARHRRRDRPRCGREPRCRHVDRRHAVQAGRQGGGLAVHRRRPVRRQRHRRRVHQRSRRADHPGRPFEDRDRPDRQRHGPPVSRRPGTGRPRPGQGTRRPHHARSNGRAASHGTLQRWPTPSGRQESWTTEQVRDSIAPSDSIALFGIVPIYQTREKDVEQLTPKPFYSVAEVAGNSWCERHARAHADQPGHDRRHPRLAARDADLIWDSHVPDRSAARRHRSIDARPQDVDELSAETRCGKSGSPITGWPSGSATGREELGERVEQVIRLLRPDGDLVVRETPRGADPAAFDIRIAAPGGAAGHDTSFRYYEHYARGSDAWKARPIHIPDGVADRTRSARIPPAPPSRLGSRCLPRIAFGLGSPERGHFRSHQVLLGRTVFSALRRGSHRRLPGLCIAVRRPRATIAAPKA